MYDDIALKRESKFKVCKQFGLTLVFALILKFVYKAPFLCINYTKTYATCVNYGFSHVELSCRSLQLLLARGDHCVGDRPQDNIRHDISSLLREVITALNLGVWIDRFRHKRFKMF